MRRSSLPVVLSTLMALAVPGRLSAHEGHPWLAGALLPWLGPDHVLATLFVAIVVSLALWALFARDARRRSPERGGSPDRR